MDGVGDLEAQLGLALAEQQSLRIRATQAERGTARAEDEAETLADRGQKSNQVLTLTLVHTTPCVAIADKLRRSSCVISADRVCCQILDAKRVVIFKLQMLMRSIKTKYEHELQSYRMQVSQYCV